MDIKRISQLPVAEELTQTTNVLIEDNGSTKRIPASRAIPSGVVKSVNGAAPDKSGNVAVEIPEGFSGSWNDLTDKPFGIGPNAVIIPEDTYTLSGSVVSQGTYTPETFVPFTIGSTYAITIDGVEYQVIAETEKYLRTDTTNTGGGMFTVYAKSDSATYTFEETGGGTQELVISVMCYADLVQISESYIPDSIARKDDVVSLDMFNNIEFAIGKDAHGHNDIVFVSGNVLPSSAFLDNENIATVSLPRKLSTIEESAFNGCTNLALTSLPEGVITIGPYAFYGCTNLALTSLPEGVTDIQLHTFTHCTNLALTSLPAAVTAIEQYAFNGCTNLALTSLPEGVITIGPHAFYGCTNLALTSLPEGLTRILENTFRGCHSLALTSIPAGIERISAQAFAACLGLTTITFLGKPTKISDDVFDGCVNLTTINVPWVEGEVANAPWGAKNATINYSYVAE